MQVIIGAPEHTHIDFCEILNITSMTSYYSYAHVVEARQADLNINNIFLKYFGLE